MEENYLHTNHLAQEKSPYLLQHAHNPVNWFPWKLEAFELARQQDKPIFLSIGYATCHWCHVMEKESFQNEEIASLMNQVFINIKVDREELPEVDSLYMEFAQSMIAGSVGWPLNVILTPDLHPFFAMTYIRLEGLKELTQRIQQIWHTQERQTIEGQAEKIVQIFSEAIHVTGLDIPEKESLHSTLELFYKIADPVYGGLKGAPKFPIGYQIKLFLELSAQFKDARALFLAERTLVMMQRGGIYDHLGGGFSRYSVDERWMVPHFEKMIYDNALLVESYVLMWQVTKRAHYRTISEQIFDYVLRKLTFFEGGFFSAEDADSEEEEGAFYTWTIQEITHILAKHQPHLFCEYYNVTAEGNFEGKNILYTTTSIEEFAASRGLNPLEFSKLLEEQRKILWKIRESRPHPFKDDKILLSWNGLMIHSFALAGGVYTNPYYLEVAVAGAQFIYDKFRQGSKLLRRYREEDVRFSANLDDYAFFIRSLLTLFEMQQGSRWLEWATQLCDVLENEFKALGGAFFQTDGKDRHLILRKCQYSDGAEPSGNAIHCENLLRLYQITGRAKYLEQAEDILKAVKKYLDSYPLGYSYHAINLCRYYDKKAPLFVICLNASKSYVKEISQAILQQYIPHRVLVWKFRDDPLFDQLLPEHAAKEPIDGKTTLYICYEGICKSPLSDLAEILEALHHLI